MKNKSIAKKIQNDAQKKKKRRKIVVTTLCVLIFAPLAAFAIAVGVFNAWASGVELDKNLMPTKTALPVFYDVNGEKIDYIEEDYLSPNDVPDNLKNAFVALEDKRFYSHKGYDPVRMAGALVGNIKAGELKEGASTITQQLVKNTHLTQEKTIKRKLKEIAIAKKVEKEYSKDEILSMYLSVIYFGNGAYGVKDASKTYFAKDVEELSLSECATLAGIVKNPKKYSPFSDVDECKKRRDLVLSVMKKEGYISESEYQSAIAEPVNAKRKDKSEDFVATYLKKASAEVCKKLAITQYELDNSGYGIYTNLDMALQKAVTEIGKSADMYESDSIDSMIIVVDNLTHKIAACYSSLQYEVKAQPGSVLKPIAVFAPAINENVISLATPVVDERMDFSGYSPHNYADKYYGETTIREGIKKSMNSVALKTLSYIGIDKSVQYISQFGIELEYFDKNMALALGATANGVSPFDIAKAYGVFANGGEKYDNSFVSFVSDGARKIYVKDDASNRVISSACAQIITSALVDTVKDGTAKTLSALPFDVAAKTGTAQRADGLNGDAWCASYNTEYSVLVWHGAKDGMQEKGGGYPAKQCAKVWKAIYDCKSLSERFETTGDVTFCDVDCYATKKNKQVMLASENTPIEYRKTEIFSTANLPAVSCEFDKIDDFDFNLQSVYYGIEVSFDCEPIYEYKVYRNQFGVFELVATADGDIGRFEFVDRLVLPAPCTYKVECSIKNNPNAHVEREKTIYPDLQ